MSRVRRTFHVKGSEERRSIDFVAYRTFDIAPFMSRAEECIVLLHIAFFMSPTKRVYVIMSHFLCQEQRGV